MIEPHNAITVRTARVMPPKPEAKIRVPVSEAFYAALLAGEAKKCNERYRQKWGQGNQGELQMIINERRKDEAAKLRKKRGEEIMLMLAERPMRTVEVVEAMGIAESTVSDVIRDLRADNRIEAVRHGATSLWRIVRKDAAE